MINLKVQKPAKRYAEALFEALNNYDFILDEINAFLNAINKNPQLKSFLYHPVIKKEDKKQVIKEICKNFNKQTIDFFLLLVDENRFDCLFEIRNFLQEKINIKNNISVVDVTLAIDGDENLKETIKTRLENKFNKKLSINFIKDESIIGGMLIKKGDTLMDLSIKTKMENFKRI